MTTTHQSSHITNVCKFCGLFDAYWDSIPQCPGRDDWNRRQAEARNRVPEFRVEFLDGRGTNWAVYLKTPNRQNAIQKARELAAATGRRHYVRISTRTGDRTIYKTA